MATRSPSSRSCGRSRPEDCGDPALARPRDLVTIETVERPPAAKPDDPNPPAPSRRARAAQLLPLVVEPERPAERVIVQTAGIAVARQPVDLSLTTARAGSRCCRRVRRDGCSTSIRTAAASKNCLRSIPAARRTRCLWTPRSLWRSPAAGRATSWRSAASTCAGSRCGSRTSHDTHAFPNFVTAPAAGRFAFSGTSWQQAPGSRWTLRHRPLRRSRLRVYQSSSGRQLLQLDCSVARCNTDRAELRPLGRWTAFCHRARRCDRGCIGLPGMSAAEEEGVAGGQEPRARRMLAWP